MVLRICRGVLGDPHAAEDAFQATFLVLFRRAGAIRNRESVGPWLHGVAHRVASCARTAAARRRVHERRWSERRREATPHAASDPHDLDLPATIHAELGCLPERYRAPIVLCDLEDHSLDEAARSSAGRWGRSRAGSIAAGSSSATGWCAAASRRGSPGWRLRVGLDPFGRCRGLGLPRTGRGDGGDDRRSGERAGRRAGPGRRSWEDDTHGEAQAGRGRRDRAGDVGHRDRGDGGRTATPGAATATVTAAPGSQKAAATGKGQAAPTKTKEKARRAG